MKQPLPYVPPARSADGLNGKSLEVLDDLIVFYEKE